MVAFGLSLAWSVVLTLVFTTLVQLSFIQAQVGILIKLLKGLSYRQPAFKVDVCSLRAIASTRCLNYMYSGT